MSAAFTFIFGVIIGVFVTVIFACIAIDHEDEADEKQREWEHKLP